MANLDRAGFQAPPGRLERRAALAHQEDREEPDHQDHEEPPASPAHPDRADRQGLSVPVDHLALEVSEVFLDSQEDLDHQVSDEYKARIHKPSVQLGRSNEYP